MTVKTAQKRSSELAQVIENEDFQDKKFEPTATSGSLRPSQRKSSGSLTSLLRLSSGSSSGSLTSLLGPRSGSLTSLSAFFSNESDDELDQTDGEVSAVGTKMVVKPLEQRALENGFEFPKTRVEKTVSGSPLATNMSKETRQRLSALSDRPGLAFYTSYAHVSDVASHLSSITDACSYRREPGSNEDPYAYSTLLSCTLIAQELLVGLLYRCSTIDFRPGVDKVGLGLLVGEIVRSFASVLQMATSLGPESSTGSQWERNSESEEQKAPSLPNVSSPAASHLTSISDAASLGLLCSSSKSALRSVVALLDDPNVHRFVKTDDIDESLSQMRKVLGVDSRSSTEANETRSFGLPYHQSACTLPQLLLQSHDHGSSHGPEDYTFQVPHVILELFFWYIENILFPQTVLEGAISEKSEALILTSSILDICAKVITILDLMLLADFHPLRVVVHGSSGFYSEAWHRIRAWISRAYRATTSSMNLDQIHLCPEMFVKDSLYLQRLDRASASFRALSFRHYILAQRTIGSTSMGSAGKTFEHMESAFLPHPNYESNAAKYRAHEYTNVKYSEFVGLGTEAVVEEAKIAAGDDFVLDHVGHDLDGDCSSVHPASKSILAALETCFLDSNVHAFMDLFDTANCRIEHPPGTLAYVGPKIKAYFLNMEKRHPVFYSFKCSNTDGTNIIIDVDADLFEGTRVRYQIHGECKVDKAGSKILRLALEGQPDMSKELCERNDQRMFAWAGAFEENSGAVLQESFRRPLAPAEILAYELNKSKSGKKVSDGLTIVARSLIRGYLPRDDLVQSAVNQVARRNVLLTAEIKVTAEGYNFVTSNESRKINLQIIESSQRLHCAPYLNTQFECDKGDMIRVIISKLGSPSADPSFELVTVMFHGICDAISVRDLHSQLLHRLALLSASSDSPGRLSVLNERILPTALTPPAIHFARRTLSMRAIPAAEPLPLPDPAPIYIRAEEAARVTEEGRKSMAITRKLNADLTKTLMEACRRENTTVHAAIGAASLLSANCGGSKRKVLTSAVDLRRRLGMPNSDLLYSVGGFDGSAAFEYDMQNYEEKEDKFWKLCHSIRKDLVDSIDSGRLLTTYLSSVEGLVGAYKGGFLDDGVFGTVFLSNIGCETYQKEIGPFQWLDFDYIYGQFLPGGPHYHITCSTFDGHLTLNFQYVSPTIPESEANFFADSTMKLLVEQIHTL